MSDSMPNFWDEGVTSGENSNSYGSVLQEENIAVALASNGNNGNGNGNGQGNNGNGNGQGHICTNPDEHGPQGNGHGYGHYKGNAASANSEGDGYSFNEGSVNKNRITSNVIIDILSTAAWIPEGNDNSKHTKDPYTPDSDNEPLSEFGVPIDIYVKPQRGTKTDAYLSDISIDLNIYDENGDVTLDENGNNRVIGKLYMVVVNEAGKLESVELPHDGQDASTYPDAYGNIYKFALQDGIFSISFTLGPDSENYPVNLSSMGGLYFVPADELSDADIDLPIEATCTNGNKTKTQSGDGYIAVDAVADLPEYDKGSADSSITVGPSTDVVLEPENTTYEDGSAVQVIRGSLSSDGVTRTYNLGDFTFHDYEDGSEEHFLLVKVNPDSPLSIATELLGTKGYEAFTPIPAGTGLELVWLNGDSIIPDADVDSENPSHVQYYKINIDNSWLAGNQGKVNLNLPVAVAGGAKDDDYSLEVKACARELVSEADVDDGINDEWDFDNNFAAVDVDAVQVKIQSIASSVKVTAGWVYESSAVAGTDVNPDADPTATGFGDGQATREYIFNGAAKDGSAAVIRIHPELLANETLGNYVVLTFDHSRGDLYDKNGKMLSAGDEEGYATIPSSRFIGTDNPIYFIPNPDSDDHSDIAITYEFDINVPDGDSAYKQFKVKGEIPIVVDAVADPADMTIKESGEIAADHDGFSLDYHATLRNDSTETQYIVIKDTGGLLTLGELGDLKNYLEKLDPAVLKEFDSTENEAKKFFDNLGQNDIIFKIKDLAGLAAFTGNIDSSGNVHLDIDLPFLVMNRDNAPDDVKITVQTIVIEKEGNNRDNWTGDAEYDFANNIALEEKTATIHLAKGKADATTSGEVYEGDNSQQNLKEGQQHTDNGATIDITLTDPYEAVRELSFTFSTPDGSPVAGAMAFGIGGKPTLLPIDGKLVFSSTLDGGKAKYTKVDFVDKDGNAIRGEDGQPVSFPIEPAATLAEINARNFTSGLRFIPSGDNDADVIINISGRVVDVRSGDVITVPNLASATIVRDAVADLPTNVAAAVLDESGTPAATVVAGATITLKIDSTFGDYADGSEAHYIFVSREHLASVTVQPEQSSYFSVLDDTAADNVFAKVKGANGIPDADVSNYFVIEVSPDYPVSFNGKISLSLQAVLLNDDSINKDDSAEIAVKAVAVEYDGFNTQDISATNKEITADNNVAVIETMASISWATLEKEFGFSSSSVHENDYPDQNTTSTPAPENGTPIIITSKDPSEVITELTVSFANVDGKPAAGKFVIATSADSFVPIANGSTITFEYDDDYPTECIGIKFIDANGDPQEIAVKNLSLAQASSQFLRYIPDTDDNHSDKDVIVRFTGTALETESGEQGAFGPEQLRIDVDAVADLPDGDRSDYTYANGNTAIEAGKEVSFTVDTAFRDLDGSENHYLLVNTKYLGPDSWSFSINGKLLDPSIGTILPDATALFGQIDGTPGLKPAADDRYVALLLDNDYLASNGGNVSLTVNGKLLDAGEFIKLGNEYGPKKDLRFDVKAVAVEYEGYKTQASLPEDNTEINPKNNVAVTDLDVKFRWDVLSNGFNIEAETAYEDNQREQDTGNYKTGLGAALGIHPEDPTEVITKLTLSYKADHGDIVLTLEGYDDIKDGIKIDSGTEITFSYDDDKEKPHVTAVTVNGATYAIQGKKTIHDLTGSCLKYVPHQDNDDSDVEITFIADTLETTIGAAGKLEKTVTMVVDAVADMPLDTKAESHITNGKGNTAIYNPGTTTDSFEIILEAKFGDYTDGSESHYVFISKKYVSDVDGLPSGVSKYDGNVGELLKNAGVVGDYHVLVVSPDAIGDTGLFKGAVTAHLGGNSMPSEDGELKIGVKFAAIEYDGLATSTSPVAGEHDSEKTAANNVSIVDGEVTLNFARLDVNKFVMEAGNAFEGDMPGQHQGSDTKANGAGVAFYPGDESEVFKSLKVDYVADGAAPQGALSLNVPVLGEGNASIAIANGATITFEYRNLNQLPPRCIAITVTDENGEAKTYRLATDLPLKELLGAERLRYIPDTKSQSDEDVTIAFSGKLLETATNEEGDFSHSVNVKVDAVADMPETASSEVSQVKTAGSAGTLDPSAPFNIDVNVNFGDDVKDGSESHYIFISKAYLSNLEVPKNTPGVELLADDQADIVCRQVKGQAGIPDADSGRYYVLKVHTELDGQTGLASLNLTGTLKSPDELQSLGKGEGESIPLNIKAVSVEHKGFLTETNADLGNGHGMDVDRDNNVAVKDASTIFTFAAADGSLANTSAKVYEGSQPDQHLGFYTTVEGGNVKIALADENEIFTKFSVDYDNSHGSLTLAGVELEPGAQLAFIYHPENPTECVGITIQQGSQPDIALSFEDATTGRGLKIGDLTSGYLRYTPYKDDNSDVDVRLTLKNAAVRDTTSGATATIETSDIDIVVDAVADKPHDLDAGAAVIDGTGSHPAARPKDKFTISLKAQFDDYETRDGSEAHYFFIEKAHVHNITDVKGATLITNTADLTAIFSSLFLKGGTGIHAANAAQKYHVLKIDNNDLIPTNGAAEISFKSTAKEVGIHKVEAIAVSIERDGYKTNENGIAGKYDKEITAENNVAETEIRFNLNVREFTPDKVVVSLDENWAFENDRSTGDDKYHPVGDNSDRDNGVPLNITSPADGQVVSSITFEFDMPENGSPVPHKIVSMSSESDVTVKQTISGNKVTVTVESVNPYGSVGELRFITGDNYDNKDVDITITQIHVADPLLHTTTKDDPDWGTGVKEGSEKLHVKVDAVAQAPGLGEFVVDHDSGNPVLAGEKIHIKGEVSFEDTNDGSEEHFILLEIQDGYYPDEVTLEFNGVPVTIPVVHYQPGQPANYTLQQLITPDDGQPHMFMKIPVDSWLAEMRNGDFFERMDGIKMDVTYQTRDWAPEGTSLHFAAIANEDVEGVREYDAAWNIINDELPFDRQLLKYVPDLTVMDNNTAITVAAQGAYVYWDEYDSDLLNFKGYVFENDRPSDHLRKPAYVLDLPEPAEDIVQNYPVDVHLQPFDPVENTGRDFGTGYQLNIPANIHEFTIHERIENLGKGDFYYLPATVWANHMRSPGPDTDAAISSYRVDIDQPTAGHDGHILVFIPSNEPYGQGHQENDAAGGDSHSDHDYRFDYEFVTNEYSPSGAYRGQKHYYGENKVIRIDAVANQAQLLSAETGVAEKFSLWNLKDTVSEFDLTVSFHDMDRTEDHYILVEVVPNFAFRCGDYYYRPRGGGNVSPTDNNAIYTHVHTDEKGNQSFARYYKVPVDLADIDPVTGNATVHVEFVPLPGMPAVADYPSSDLLTYGALTEDKTCSRWDSNDPTSVNFVNRKGADGEYSYENNTSVIIRNGIGNGADDAGLNPGWWDPYDPIIPPDDPDNPIPTDPDDPKYNPMFNWPGGPNEPLIPILKPRIDPDKPWHPTIDPNEPNPWIPPVDPEPQPGPWIPPYDPDIPVIPTINPDDPNNPDLWVASRGQGLAIQWVFENSTPLGHIEAGQYDRGLWPTSIYLTDDRPNDAAYVKITIPAIEDRMIIRSDFEYSSHIPWVLNVDTDIHSRALLGLLGGIGDPSQYISVEAGPNPDEVTYTILTPNGQLPENSHLQMWVAPDSKGEDFPLKVAWYDSNGKELSSGSVDVLVDAVAQWANFTLESEDGIYGVTGDAPTQLVSVEVNVGFLDQDGSEANYVLVEKIPGVLVLHKGENGTYDEVKEVYLEGKTYFQIEATKDEQLNNRVILDFSVNEELTSPMYVRDDIVIDGISYTGMHIDIGTMTVEGQTGWEATTSEPANWEYTLKNNTSLNLQEDALTIVISKVNATGGNSTIFVEETEAPEDHIIYIDPNDPENGLNLKMDHNDVLDSLIVTSVSGNGAFWYEDDTGRHQVTAGMDIAQYFLAGKLLHQQERYRDDDAKLEWTAQLHDGLSQNSEVTITGTLTVAVDAVAKASEITLGYPVLDSGNHTLTQELTFADFEQNEQHYAVIAPDLYRFVEKKAQVMGGDGQWHTVGVETIFSPEGDPYYAVLLDGYLDGNGHATVQFTMYELNVPGIEDFPVISGGVSIEPNSGFFASDREPVLTNNWAINTDARFVHEGSISSKDLGFTIDSITENDANGSMISFSGSIGANDLIASAVLTFTGSSATAMGRPGDQAATIIYNGVSHAVMLDSFGNASVTVDFGPGGFDPAADFRIIWGKAQIDGSGMVQVDEFNHHADGNLAFAASFTVKNLISQASATVATQDANGIDLIARADAPASVEASVTEINGISADSSQAVGAGTDSVTLTISASFADTDGSEAHYLMLEVPRGLLLLSPASAETYVLNGVSYQRIMVDSSDPRPSVDVVLQAQDGLNQNVQLRVGAMAIENGNAHASYAQATPITLKISDVSATGLDVSTAQTVEDTPLKLDFFASAKLIGNDGNDVLRGITFTNLKDGSLVDAQGNALAGGIVTAAELASGNVFYRPAANYAGERDQLGRPLPVVLEYDVQFGESDTGAVKTVSGQKLSLAITPEADAPDSLGAVSNDTVLDNIQPCHLAAISVRLEARFADADGSESHFFIINAPRGVAVLDGAGYTVSSLNADEKNALDGYAPGFDSSGTVYRLELDNEAGAVSINVNLEVTTTLYNGGSLGVIGAASEKLADGGFSYGFASAPDVALPPPVDASLDNGAPVPVASEAGIDTLRKAAVSGRLVLENIDPDMDDVTVSGLVNGIKGVDQNGDPAYVAAGLHGTLYLHEDGSYHYALNPDVYNVSGAETFTYTVADPYGGTGQSTITINLEVPNAAPTSEDVNNRIDSVRQTVIAGVLTLDDADRDAVDVASVNGVTTLVNIGTAENPQPGFEIAGSYGTLHVFEDDSGQWHYRYLLDTSHRGEKDSESFSFTVRDEHGLENSASNVITIELYDVNRAPVVENVVASLDTLRGISGEAGGAIRIGDPEGDIVALASAAGPQGAGQWDVDGAGNRAFVVRGDHGVLYIYDDGSGLRYSYVLGDRPVGGIQAVETFTYTVDDGFLKTAQGSISIDLTNANNAPVISGALNSEIDTLRSGGLIAGKLAFSDPDFNREENRHDSVSLVNAAFGGTAGVADGQGGFSVSGAYGVFHIDALGEYTYTLNSGLGALRDETEEFAVTIADEFGKTRTETVSIDLVLHNQDPSASAGKITLDTWRNGGKVSDQLVFTDPDKDTVLVTSVSGAGDGVLGTDQDGNKAYVVLGNFGTLYLQENGHYTYVLSNDAVGSNGTDTFSYSVSDGHTGTAKNSITITLDNANANPVISGNLAATIEGSVQDYQNGIISESGVFSWSDADNDPIASVTVAGQKLPAAGETVIETDYGILVVTTSGGMSASWTYTMKPGIDEQHPDDVEIFGILVSDIYGGHDARSLEIRLKPLTHAPECEDVFVDWELLPNGKPVSLVEGQLDFRDADLGYDPAEKLHLYIGDGEITETVQLEGRYGLLTISPDGSFQYNPTVSDDGRDVMEVFTYTVVDSANFQDTATLYIRLSDNAPAFPSTLDIQPAGIAPDSAQPDDCNGDGQPADSLPEPADIDLASVPLPYDPAEIGAGA